jgi:hypothetical protein
MLTFPENVVILILVLTGSMLFTVLLKRIWPTGNRREHNDLIAWQLSVIGTPYAVILGFMLYAVWTSFGAAEHNVNLEANALRNVYRLAYGLPPQQQVALLTEVRNYADTVVNRDWPDMAHSRLPEQSHRINQDMWKTVLSVRAGSPAEITAVDHALSELSVLTEHRRIRLLQSTYRLPIIFWCVLLVGGLITVTSVSLFGAANPRLHAIQVFFYTLLITLILLAIADVNRPFRGWVHVSNDAFLRAQQTFGPTD